VGESSFSAAELECFSGRGASMESSQKEPSAPDAFAWPGRYQPVRGGQDYSAVLHSRWTGGEQVPSECGLSGVFPAIFLHGFPQLTSTTRCGIMGAAISFFPLAGNRC